MKVFTIIAGVILIIAGIICLFIPGATFLTVGWLLGLALLISGASLVIDYVVMHRVGAVNGMDLVLGIFTAAMGLLVLLNQQLRFATEIAMVYLLGIWLVVGGILRLVQAVRARKEPGSLWGWTLTVGILMILVGVYSFFHPGVSMFAIGWLIGFYILLAGVDLLSFAFTLRRVDDPTGTSHWTMAGQ